MDQRPIRCQQHFIRSAKADGRRMDDLSIILDHSRSMESMKPHLVVIALQLLLAGAIVIARMAFVKGMNSYVFVAYRHVIAAFAIAPFAFVLERRDRPPLTWMVLFKVFVLGCGLAICQNIYFLGVFYTSSTLGSAALNMLPVATILIAGLLRLENLNIKDSRGRAKVGGMIICIGGAVVMALYKGPLLALLTIEDSTNEYTADQHNVALGAVMLLGSTAIWAGCIVFQGSVIKTYPAHLSLTTLICIMAALASGVAAMALQFKKSDAWSLGWNVQLLSILYSGIVGSALGIAVQGWVIKKKGPVFVAIFSPLCMIVTAVMELLVFHMNPHLGSVVGAVFVVVGLYSVLWGKAKEHGIAVSSKDENMLQMQQLNQKDPESQIIIST